VQRGRVTAFAADVHQRRVPGQVDRLVVAVLERRRLLERRPQVEVVVDGGRTGGHGHPPFKATTVAPATNKATKMTSTGASSRVNLRIESPPLVPPPLAHDVEDVELGIGDHADSDAGE